MGHCSCQTGRYKEHFVCFACRKMFERPSLADLPASRCAETYAEYAPPCPDCGRPMHNMGKEFEPPSRRDYKSWRDIEHRRLEIRRASMTSPQSGVWQRRHGQAGR